MALRPLHITMVPANAEHVTLRYCRDNPNEFNKRDVPMAEFRSLLARAEANYYAFSEPDLVAVGRRLYDWLDGTHRWLARELDALRGSTVALLIDATSVLAPLHGRLSIMAPPSSSVRPTPPSFPSAGGRTARQPANRGTARYKS